MLKDEVSAIDEGMEAMKVREMSEEELVRVRRATLELMEKLAPVMTEYNSLAVLSALGSLYAGLAKLQGETFESIVGPLLNAWANEELHQYVRETYGFVETPPDDGVPPC